MKAESRASAEKHIEASREEYGAKYPNAVATLTRDQAKLLTFFDFPAEQWVHIRTSNPIESAFATVRLRQRSTRGAGSRQRRLTMEFRLLEMAQLRWRRLNGAALLPLLRARVPFKGGVRWNGTIEQRSSRSRRTPPDHPNPQHLKIAHEKVRRYASCDGAR
jgi:putative transposase